MAVRNIFDVIKGPVLSDKVLRLNKTTNQLVLYVDIDATKSMIKDALKKLFKVEVKSVRTKIDKSGKLRTTMKRYNATPTIKKTKVAYVSLADGHTLSLFDQSGMPTVSADASGNADNS